MTFDSPGSYRILTRAIDTEGNEAAWDETTVNVPFFLPHQGNTVAFVRPTFTEAAYSPNGFYTFYDKYDESVGEGVNVTKDLYMLTTTLPISVSGGLPVDVDRVNVFKNWTNLTAITPTEEDQNETWTPLLPNLKNAEPSATFTIIRDEDVHDGHIFKPDGTNAFNVLFLVHNEYVTQSEYDNLKRFVSNGGTLVFVDANTLYAEVHLDKARHTATLVKGHGWEYDGNAARKSVDERWFNESREWKGSNYIINSISDRISFANNPFNYTHFEEDFVNNPKDKIMIDYQIKFPPIYLHNNYLPPGIKSPKDIKVAAYQLDYGKGKVVALGLFGQIRANNPAFTKFLANFNETSRPTAKITNPPYPPSHNPSVPTTTITVNGTASDAGSGIQKVEAFAHTYPFNKAFPFKSATPSSPGNWSEWSIPINITGPGDHRVLVQATDNAGNQNWTEITVNIQSIPFTTDKVTIVPKPPGVNNINQSNSLSSRPNFSISNETSIVNGNTSGTVSKNKM